jgi:hypothetical protein
MKSTFIPFLLLCTSIFLSCSNDNQAQNSKYTALSPDFGKYWYQGKAEVSTYKLVQERYNQMREGYVVNVFVTEDMSKSKQVKLDNPDKNPNDKITVLKLNQIKRFETGIYDYSIMSSVFTPVDLQQHPNSIKSTLTVQDWCGQTFTQSNLNGGSIKIKCNSYFESEGDSEVKINKTLTEDELWNRIRIDPTSIPMGKVKILPTLLYNRFKHIPAKVEEAMISTSESTNIKTLTVQYTSIKRYLKINYDAAFPYQILGWEESITDGKVTKATLIKTILSDYWTKNGNDFNGLRDSIGLPDTKMVTPK